MYDHNFFFTECPICGVYKFRTFDHQKLHAHFVVCSAIEAIYKRCVIEPNKGKTKDSQRTIVDAEIARIDIELGICSAAWVNPYFIKPEDRVFLSEEQLRNPSSLANENKEVPK